MRINTNVAALNSYNQLKNTQNNLSKSLSRLSSGKRINGAADDAAGLAISEKMGSQTRGLAQAQRNAQDGISMIQTAEGALKESHSILQRMRELSVQSANDTNTEADRAEIQKEVDQLSQELSRIGKTTEFNTQKLLDGSLDDTKFQIGANEGQNMSVSINDMRGYSLGATGNAETELTATVADGTNTTTDITGGAADGTYTVDGTDLKNSDGIVVATSDATGETWTGNSAGAIGDDVITFAQGVDSGQIVIEDDAVTGTATFDNNGLEAGEYDLNFGATTSTLTDANGNVVATSSDATQFTSVEDGSTTLLTLDNAATADMDINVSGLDVSSQTAADDAITTLDNAIANVSAERSKLGAVQNRLDHTINNLNTAEENLTAAESRISDVDMAKEMMNMSKQQILSQAGTAMMAQANQLPQGVLQLLG
jgi:flagellin